MTTKQEIQSLLRFLAQDAKVPLPVAMPAVKELQKEGLTTPETLSKTALPKLHAIFPDTKHAKSILAASKRVSKKRSSSFTTPTSSPNKKRVTSFNNPFLNPTVSSPASIEASLALPTTTATESEISSTVLLTNRAPLVLAFAVTLLKYSMPSQPLSSRLSLAQAVVSANSRSKAESIGLLERGTGAEEEGWGVGQPGVKVMGREVKVMRRWGYDPLDNGSPSEAAEGVKSEDGEGGWDKDVATQETLKEEPTDSPSGLGTQDHQENVDKHAEHDPPLWGLDLEALRKSNGPLATPSTHPNGSNLPIHRPEHARAYLLKSFASVEPPPPSPSSSTPTSPSKKKTTLASQAKQKEENLARLLSALDTVFASWSSFLKTEELDRRAWGWYVHVRPAVKDGVAGWGGKGEVKLGKVLELRR